MCGIFCSTSRDKIAELAELNSYRGSHSYSVFSVNWDVNYVIRDFGEFNLENVPDDDAYKICHVQAPTTDNRDVKSIHPARHEGMLLWHNGIVKNFDVARLMTKYNQVSSWDTMLLLREISNDDWLLNLSEVNGSFACVLYDEGSVFVFRNEISPLFFDNDLNISSVKFEGSDSIPPNRVFMVSQDLGLIDIGCEFHTKENPYYFGEAA